MTQPSRPADPPTALQAALRSLCPRCGSPGLFEGVGAFAPCCRACGLDFTRFNVGDGPAAFLTLLIGALITVLAILFELAVEPPLWVHVLLWFPLTIAAVIFSLRFAKAMLLALEWSGRHAPGMAEDCRGQSSPDHGNSASEGRIEEAE